MKRSMFDPKARAAEAHAARRKEANEAKLQQEAEVRARNMALLMGIEEDDRPFWPGSSVSLRIGAIRPMRISDSLVGKSGLQGDLVASASSYVLDIPNYADVGLHLDDRAHVEFIAGTSSRMLGVRLEPSGEWTFIVVLAADDMNRLRSFATEIDPGEAPWSLPEATVLVRSEALRPIPNNGHETVNFAGLVSDIKFGTPAPTES